MTKVMEVGPAKYEIPCSTMSLHFTRNGEAVEVCRFVLLENGYLDIQIAPGIPLTAAAHHFIDIVREQIDNMPALDLLGADVSGHG